MTTSTLPDDKYVERIDVVRGFSILLVVIFHAYGTVFAWGRKPWSSLIPPNGTGEEWLSSVLYLTHFARLSVPMLFVISGYVIHLSFLRDSRFTWSKYLTRRLWRIYPAYLVALFGFAIWQGVVGTQDFWLHFFLLHNTTNATFLGINGSFWSLAVEFQLYLLYPLAILARRAWGLGGMLALGYAASAAWRIVAAIQGDWPTEANYHIWNGPIPFWCDWLLGAYLAERHMEGQRVFQWPWLWAPLGLAMWLAGEDNLPLQSIQFSTASFACAVLLESFVLRTRPVNKLGQTLAFVGVCSYSLYLIHFPPMFEFVKFLTSCGVPQTAQFLVFFPSYIMVSITLAWVMYAAVEVPGRSLARRFFARADEHQVAAAAEVSLDAANYLPSST